MTAENPPSLISWRTGTPFGYWCTDIVIRWQGKFFASRMNYPVPDSPANREAALADFLRRRKKDGIS